MELAITGAKRIPINRQGYDRTGYYYGIGMPLYRVDYTDGEYHHCEFTRAANRYDAMIETANRLGITNTVSIPNGLRGAIIRINNVYGRGTVADINPLGGNVFHVVCVKQYGEDENIARVTNGRVTYRGHTRRVKTNA